MLQEGQEILEGRFKIIKKLGSGAFGEIFKGKPISSEVVLTPVSNYYIFGNFASSGKEKIW